MLPLDSVARRRTRPRSPAAARRPPRSAPARGAAAALPLPTATGRRTGRPWAATGSTAARRSPGHLSARHPSPRRGCTGDAPVPGRGGRGQPELRLDPFGGNRPLRSGQYPLPLEGLTSRPRRPTPAAPPPPSDRPSRCSARASRACSRGVGTGRAAAATVRRAVRRPGRPTPYPRRTRPARTRATGRNGREPAPRPSCTPARGAARPARGACRPRVNPTPQAGAGPATSPAATTPPSTTPASTTPASTTAGGATPAADTDPASRSPPSTRATVRR